MARDEDDDDGLPPIGEGTEDFLEDAKKGKTRCFLLICKGTKVKYLKVKKKAIKKSEIADAKKLGYKGDSYIGVLTGKGMELVFNLAISDGYESEPVKDKALKDFLEEKAGFKCKPSFAIMATPPDIPFDDEDLKNPLIARFLALGDQITKVLDAVPNAEGELQQSTSGIRVLLQEGSFNEAEPKINMLEVRLKDLLNGGTTTEGSDSTKPQDSSSSPPPSSSPDVVADQEALKQKLSAALGKLVPQLKEAVAKFPEKKVELLTPVASIKQQLDAGDLQIAREGIIAVGQKLKAVLSGTSSNESVPSSSPTGPSLSELQSKYESLFAIVNPIYAEVLQKALGDTGKFRAVMTFATEKASANSFADAIKALERLKPSLEQALGTTREEGMGIESGIVEKRKFLLERFREIPAELQPLFDDLKDAMIEDAADEDPSEIIAEFERGFLTLFGELQREIDSSINSGSTQLLAGLKERILSNDMVNLLVENPFTEGSEFRERILEALTEIETELTSTP